MNVYHTAEYQDYRREFDGFFCEKYRAQRPGETKELGGGYFLRSDYYGSMSPSCHVSRHSLLDAGGKEVFAWDNINDDGEFAALFRHANGRHYLVFREDLYGYSVLEVETGQTAHYIPEKSWPLGENKFQETFIWTGVRYDPGTNLLAVSGCYWACPNGTLLLDFSNPLEEQDCEMWLEAQHIVDPEYDIYEDIDLDRFGEDGVLHFKTSSAEDGSPGGFTLPATQVLELVRKKKSTSEERG